MTKKKSPNTQRECVRQFVEASRRLRDATTRLYEAYEAVEDCADIEVDAELLNNYPYDRGQDLEEAQSSVSDFFESTLEWEKRSNIALDRHKITSAVKLATKELHAIEVREGVHTHACVEDDVCVGWFVAAEGTVHKCRYCERFGSSIDVRAHVVTTLGDAVLSD